MPIRQGVWDIIEERDSPLQLVYIAGIDLTTGYFCVEGSSRLWDELYVFRGLDETDIQNFYCVAEYISNLKKFDQLESVLRTEGDDDGE